VTGVRRHGEHLTSITRLVTNCYLVSEDDGLTLVDCLWPGSQRAILRAARSLRAPVRRIALTHAHHDHTGALESLRTELPDAELLVGRREWPFMHGDFELLPGEPRDGTLRQVAFPRRDVDPDTLLQPGDRVGSLRVVDASGHTPGQIGFLDTRDGTLICGDAWITVGTPFICHERPLRFPVPGMVGTWHGPTSLATAAALAELEPRRLASGHGSVVDDPLSAMQEALARAGI
jgi:glyoxylase-like metal-dependent hydrolase (beta-lactamase superfamily II)